MLTKRFLLIQKVSGLLRRKEDLISLCEVHDFTGRSGNGFKTETKLKEYHAENGLLLVNGVECDPRLCHDAWIYRNMFYRHW